MKMDMKIGIIGAGKVGTAFALALADNGAEISGICSRSEQSVDYLSGKLGRIFINDIARTINNADIVLLAVPDSVIAGVAVKIHEYSASAVSRKTFLHCSGALTSSELEILARDGGCTGSLHPIQTFASKEEGWKGMYGIFFGYEGSAEAREKALRLVGILKGTLLDLKPEAKPLYHAAACILSNYTVALTHISGMLLDEAGIDKNMGIKAFMPLLRNTVENIAAKGSLNALTGPIARGDSVTVAAHLSALDGREDIFFELY
ncbi:MAG: DUF2520 domain-containing protein, partial [Ruminiclostridium sp.]|nr:DUF2520 domain-containing protein [Ruminiclostridium sp.]